MRSATGINPDSAFSFGLPDKYRQVCQGLDHRQMCAQCEAWKHIPFWRIRGVSLARPSYEAQPEVSCIVARVVSTCIVLARSTVMTGAIGVPRSSPCWLIGGSARPNGTLCLLCHSPHKSVVQIWCHMLKIPLSQGMMKAAADRKRCRRHWSPIDTDRSFLGARVHSRFDGLKFALPLVCRFQTSFVPLRYMRISYLRHRLRHVQGNCVL